MFDYSIIKREICPHCGVASNVSVLFDKSEFHELPREEGWGQRASVVQCHGCNALYFVHDTSATTNVDEVFDDFGKSLGFDFAIDRKIYPEKRPVIDLILPQNTERYYEDFLRAKSLGLNALAAIAVRASLEALLVELGELNPAKDNLGPVLERMAKNHRILRDEFEALKMLKGAGDAAVHRAWFPTSKELHHVGLIFKTVAMRLYQTSTAVQALSNSVPKRPKKK